MEHAGSHRERIQHYGAINGESILDCDLSKVEKSMAPLTKYKGRTRKEGHFGFAGHGVAVAFHNVHIKWLK